MVYIRGELTLQTTFDSVAEDPHGEWLLLVMRNHGRGTWKAVVLVSYVIVVFLKPHSHASELRRAANELRSRVLSTLSIFREG